MHFHLRFTGCVLTITSDSGWNGFRVCWVTSTTKGLDTKATQMLRTRDKMTLIKAFITFVRPLLEYSRLSGSHVIVQDVGLIGWKRRSHYFILSMYRLKWRAIQTALEYSSNGRTNVMKALISVILSLFWSIWVALVSNAFKWYSHSTHSKAIPTGITVIVNTSSKILNGSACWRISINWIHRDEWEAYDEWLTERQQTAAIFPIACCRIN